MKKISLKHCFITASILIAGTSHACGLFTAPIACATDSCVQIDIFCDGELAQRTIVATSNQAETEQRLRKEWDIFMPRHDPASPSSSHATSNQPSQSGRVSNGGGFNAGYGPEASRPAQRDNTKPFTIGPTGL